jgi:hypothetical protein
MEPRTHGFAVFVNGPVRRRPPPPPPIVGAATDISLGSRS